MSTTTAHYKAFQAHQKKLVGLLDKALPLFERLEMKGWADVAKKLSTKVSTERFRVIVLGEFRRGKSTFVNALLHEDVLPAFVTPCTAVISEVKWGPKKHAVLHFRDPLPSPMPTSLKESATQHLRTHHSKTPVPPLEIDVGQLQDFVTIPDPGKDKDAFVSEPPFDRVEVFWPLELCRNGVEIIDSPGLNEHRARTKTTKDYLAQVDAVIFVMSVHYLAGESELAVVDHDVRGAGHESVFFVCNRFDELRRPSDREGVKTRAYETLTGRTKFGREGIHFLSAQNALDGRIEGDATLVERSGILRLEAALEQFLVNDRGRVKLLQPASQLARGLKVALHETIPARQAFLQSDLQKLRRIYDEALPRLQQASQRRVQMMSAVDNHRMRLRDNIRRAAQKFLRELAAMVPAWGSALSLESKLMIFKMWSLKEQSDALAKEVLQRLQPRIDAAMAEWEKSELRPLLEQGIDELTKGVNASLKSFFEQIDKLRSDLTLNMSAGIPDTDALTGKPISPMERVLAGAGGLIFSPGAAVSGAAMGYRGMLQSLLPQIGAAMVAILLGVTNPFALGAILLGAGLGQTFFKGSKMTEDAKVKVVQSLAAYLRDSAADRADEIAAKVYDQTSTISEAISEGLEREIKGVRDQIESVLKVKLAGEVKVEEQRAELATLEGDVRALDVELTEMMYAVAQVHRN